MEQGFKAKHSVEKDFLILGIVFENEVDYTIKFQSSLIPWTDGFDYTGNKSSHISMGTKSKILSQFLKVYLYCN